MPPPTDKAQLVESKLPRGQRNLYTWLRTRRGLDTDRPPESWDLIAARILNDTGVYVTGPTVQAWWKAMETERRAAAGAPE